jgi:hypothetical protein
VSGRLHFETRRASSGVGYYYVLRNKTDVCLGLVLRDDKSGLFEFEERGFQRLSAMTLRELAEFIDRLNNKGSK